MSNIIAAIEKSQVRSDLPEIKIGSTVRVNYRIIEGDKQRIQAFEGVVFAKHLSQSNLKATFTVRKVTQGHGVERTFAMHTPKIESVKIIREGVVRRAKLYYLRNLSGKSARIKEKLRR
ncbi:MAG: large subunit ribosomal protein L19 [bacterium]|jgi:large subunit ribosomal protein L19